MNSHDLGAKFSAQSRLLHVYVAGPMTGIPDFNFPAFNVEAAKLREVGFQVENPAEHGIWEGAEWQDYLRYDLTRLALCDQIHLLPDWSKSKGACLELHIANALGMLVSYADGAELVAAGERKEFTQADVTHEMLDAFKVSVNAHDRMGVNYDERTRIAIAAAMSAQPAVQAAAQPCEHCEPDGVWATDGAGPFDCYACGKKAGAGQSAPDEVFAIPVRENGKRTTAYTEVLPFTPGPGVEVLGDPVRMVAAQSAPVENDAFVPGSLADLLFQLGEKGVSVSGGTHGDRWRVRLPRTVAAQSAPVVQEGFALVDVAAFRSVLDRSDWRTAGNRAELRALLSSAPAQPAAQADAGQGGSEVNKLSDRVRPNSEAAPWVIDEIKRLEAELEAKQAAGVPDGERLAELLESVRLGDDEAKPHGSGATYWNNAVLACQVAIRDALDAAPAQPAAQQDQGWIPVSERLPESETDVLVRCVRHGNDVRHVVAGLFHDEWSSQETEYPIAGKATHWMPLPAAPGEKSGLPNNPMRQDQGEVQRLREALRITRDTIDRQLEVIASRAPGNHLDKLPVVSSLKAHRARCDAALAASTGQEVES